MKLLFILSLAFLLSVSVHAFSGEFSKNDLFRLTKEKASEEKIIALIKKHRLSFWIGLEDLKALRKLGASHYFLSMLIKEMNAGESMEISTSGEDISKNENIPLSSGENSLNSFEKLCESLKKNSILRKNWTIISIEKAVEKEKILLGEKYMPKNTFRQISEILELHGTGETLSEKNISEWKILLIALELRKAGFYASACTYLKEIINSKTEDDIYQYAIILFEDLRQNIYCPVKDTSEMIQRTAVNLPSNAFAAHCYITAKAVMDAGGDSDLVRMFLSSLEKNDREYPLAQFLLGMTFLKDELFQTVAKFFISISDIDQIKVEGITLGEASRLNLARLAFERHLYNYAVYMYRTIPIDSRIWPAAQYEKSWAEYFSGNPEAAMGGILELQNPIARSYYFPDLWLLEMYMFLDRCLIAEASYVLQQHYENTRKWQEAIAPYMLAAESYNASCNTICDHSLIPNFNIEAISQSLPSIITDPLFFKIYSAIENAKREESIFQSLKMDFPFLDILLARVSDFRNELGFQLTEAVISYLRKFSEEIQRTLINLKESEIDIADLKIKMQEHEISRMDASSGKSINEKFKKDIEEKLKEGAAVSTIINFIKIRYKNVLLTHHDIIELRFDGIPSELLDFLAENFTRKKKKEAVFDPAGMDSRLIWSFDGEFWSDEAGKLRVYLPDKCGGL